MTGQSGASWSYSSRASDTLLACTRARVTCHQNNDGGVSPGMSAADSTDPFRNQWRRGRCDHPWRPRRYCRHLRSLRGLLGMDSLSSARLFMSSSSLVSRSSSVAARRLTRAFFYLWSSLTMMYSTSSPHLSPRPLSFCKHKYKCTNTTTLQCIDRVCKQSINHLEFIVESDELLHAILPVVLLPAHHVGPLSCPDL